MGYGLRHKYYAVGRLFIYWILLQKWKISCFRHEECSSAGINRESFGEEILRDELEKSEIEKPNAGKRNWISSLEEVTLSPSLLFPKCC